MIKNLFGNRPTIEPVALKAFISPINHEALTTSGSYTTPLFTGSAVGGTAPYSYSWAITRGQPLTPTNDSTRFTLSGTNFEISADATLTVTDDTGATSKATVNLLIQFGTPR